MLVPLERTIDAFLSTLGQAHLEPAEPIALPQLRPLAEAGIPTVSEEAYQAAEVLTRRRRALLAGFLRDDGWSLGARS